MILRRLVGLAALGAMTLPASTLSKPVPKPNYIYAESGVYYYEAAITRQQREAGQVAGDAVGYRYYGQNANGEYVLAQVAGNGSIQSFFYCKKPCRVIRTGGGRRFVNNSRLLVSSAFADVFQRRLRNTNPDAQKCIVCVPARPPFDPNGAKGKISRTANGITIAAAANTPVHATADGVVEFTGRLEGYGNSIRLGHGGEIQTLYGNLSRITVSSKSAVTKGQVIGYIGGATDDGSPELIYEVRIEGNPVDPLPYLYKNDDAEFHNSFRAWHNLQQK